MDCGHGWRSENDCDVCRPSAHVVAGLRGRIAELEQALFDLVHLERTQTPDMSGKRRTYAMMQNGRVLADCLDRARELLPYDMRPTDPHHGGKISE